MYKFFIVFLLIALSFNLSANGLVAHKTLKPMHQLLKTDTSKIIIRNFNKAALNNYLKQPEFNYQTDIRHESLWYRFWRWLWHIIKNFYSSKTGSNTETHSNTAFKYFIVAIIVGLLVYVIIKVAGIESIFYREPKEIKTHYTESLENIHKITFDEQIDKAITKHNYRLAVRLLYLRSLKQLSDAKLISWQIEKTNSDYLNELSNSSQKQYFGILTKQFEYVWYGDFPVDGKSFQHINALFVDFKNTLQ